MTVVVERCSEARLRTSVDADSWDSIQQGLVIRVAVAAGASPTLVASVAQSLLSAKLSSASGGADAAEPAESVAEPWPAGRPEGLHGVLGSHRGGCGVEPAGCHEVRDSRIELL
ncbi:unnamed protein product [Prorocentrum cordatum]|uniref:Uncharacterized protein n=1 Tax=Prorocentrum cordatum TaxID=2364126 RepID=A0ABN9XGF0_9DINO|nr:unnamed protein product [Polarella glacialis]